MSLIKREGESLSDKLRARLNQKQAVNGESCLLLDISSSMNGLKIAKLRTLADQFKGTRRFEFSTWCQELAFTEQISDDGGGTAMHVAFEFIKKAGIKHTVLITDGEPDNEQLALDAAKGLRIDILYVGPDPAPDFLRHLCRGTGGKYGDVTLDDIKSLTTRIKGMLPSGTINL